MTGKTTNKFRRKLLRQKVNLEKVEQKYICSQSFFFFFVPLFLETPISKILVFNMSRYGLFPWKTGEWMGQPKDLRRAGASSR